jgi:hypothetical protein
MEQTNKLMHDISNAESHTSQIESDVKKVSHDLDSIHQDLAISKKINQSLNDLSSSLTIAKELLTVVSIIPEIGSEASALKNTISEFQIPIKSALACSNKIEKVIKPVRSSIEKIEPKIEKVDTKLLSIMNIENQFVSSLGSATHCINSLPNSTIKSNLVEEIEKASEAIDSSVLQFDKTQLGLLAGVEAAKDQCEKIKSWTADLINLNKEINAVINRLKPLISALKAIKRVFKYVIRVPYGGYPKFCKKWGVPYPCGWHTVYFSFSIGQILHGISGVLAPIMNLLNKAMNAILSPLLKALNLNINLPSIPGLVVLDNLMHDLESTYKSITEPFNELIKELDFFSEFITDIHSFIHQIDKINNACLIKNKK